MREPDEVAAMLRLRGLGWGVRRIAAEFGCSHVTVRRYLAAGGWTGLPEAASCEGPGWAGGVAGRAVSSASRQRRCRPPGPGTRERHRGQPAHGRAGGRATAAGSRGRGAGDGAVRDAARPPAADRLRRDTDFDRRRRVRVHLFVATLGYSRRCFVRAFRHERQSAWFDGIEAAFRHFGGVPEEVLLDNARALVEQHDAATREVRFNPRLHAFARYWGFRPRACAPYRARTKGKDERGVGYVKRNAIAGHRFASWAAWRRIWRGGCARSPIRGCTARPASRRFERFRRDEAAALRPLDGRPPFRRSASWCAGFRPTAASSSTPTATACRGG